MRLFLRGCATSLLLAVATAASDSHRTLATEAPGRPIRSVDELDPVKDYGSRHRIIDEYILFPDQACTDTCLDGVRARLQESPHRCRDVKVLEAIHVMIATCPSSAAAGELHFRHVEFMSQLSAIPHVANVIVNEGQVMLHPSENPATMRGNGNGNGNGASGGKRTKRQLQDLSTMNPYSWGIDRIDQTSPLDAGSAIKYDSTFLGESGEGVEVIIMDTGITMTHSQFSHLSSKISVSAIRSEKPETDGNGHGTHVASTAMGRTLGVARLPKATLISVKVLSRSGSGSGSAFLDGLNYAVSRARANRNKRVVVNMSLGFSGVYSPADDVIRAATASEPNLIWVSAAGNDNQVCGTQTPNIPALVVNVGAMDRADTRAVFSDYGSRVALYAPGVAIVGAVKGTTTGIVAYSGTSMACPHIVGAIAQLMAKELALIAADPNAPKCSCANLSNIQDCVYVKFLATTQKVKDEEAVGPSIAYIGLADDFTCAA